MDTSILHTRLFEWFRQHGRILPWREKQTTTSFEKKKTTKKVAVLRDVTIASYFTSTWQRDPYRIIISELMLQQTQVDRVLPKFEEFLSKWPTVQDLAQAKLSEVLIVWQGLGYNRRARFLHEMAQAIVQKHSGIFPQNEEELRMLPGVGEYTARAILTFAFGKDVGVIDTNIRRIFSRVLFGQEVNEVKLPSKAFAQTIDELVPQGKGDPWNQTLMDFGALVCTAKSPKCESCPIADLCTANLQAQKNGYENYAIFLASRIKSAVKKDRPKEKFEQTDRYFRGRIVDRLREGSIHMEELRVFMEVNHGLTDRLRWGLLIERLVLDKLIAVRGSMVQLP